MWRPQGKRGTAPAGAALDFHRYSISGVFVHRLIGCVVAKRGSAQGGDMDSRQELGRYGEDVAAHLLAAKGFEVLARNWRCARGELDLVARRGDTLAAVEVKTRRTLEFGSPVEAVTERKARRLRYLVATWLQEWPQSVPLVRVDVVAVYAPRGGRTQVRHLEGVA